MIWLECSPQQLAKGESRCRLAAGEENLLNYAQEENQIFLRVAVDGMAAVKLLCFDKNQTVGSAMNEVISC